MARCERCHNTQATRLVNLRSSVVDITRGFCDACAAFLCAAPVAGITSTSSGVREPMHGFDVGPIRVGN